MGKMREVVKRRGRGSESGREEYKNIQHTSLYAVNSGIKWLCICGCLRPILLSAQKAKVLLVNQIVGKRDERGGIPAFLTN